MQQKLSKSRNDFQILSTAGETDSSGSYVSTYWVDGNGDPIKADDENGIVAAIKAATGAKLNAAGEAAKSKYILNMQQQ